MNIKNLNNLTRNNNKIIEAIDSGKKINIEKSIRACLLSNNSLIRMIIEDYVEYKMENSNKDNYTGGFKGFDDLFGKGFSK